MKKLIFILALGFMSFGAFGYYDSPDNYEGGNPFSPVNDQFSPLYIGSPFSPVNDQFSPLYKGRKKNCDPLTDIGCSRY